jgi:hypothetical protein
MANDMTFSLQTKSRWRLGRLVGWLFAVAFLALPGLARAADPPPAEPKINPYECYGRWESLTGNRTVSEMRWELERRMIWLKEPGEPNTIVAMKNCTVGRLKARLGDADTYEYFKKAIELDPTEPGYELWAGQYWSGNRGAKRPVAEMAEKHYYAGLRKIEALKAAGRMKDYHYIAEDWIRRDLNVLYQQDGQPLLPWKAYPHKGDTGLYTPGVSISSQLRVARDTRDFWFNNEARQFTGEQTFANSDIRANGTLTDRQKWEIARAPLRLQNENKLRIRHNYLGTFDGLYTYLHQYNSQITSFYKPTEYFNDVVVHQVGGGYERVFPLYPLFDLRLAGTVQRIYRSGCVEFLPDRREDFWLYEFKPSVSRFFGVDKLTVNAVWARLNIPDTIGAPPEQAIREKTIRAINFEYGLYSMLALPSLAYGTLSSYRTPTRGLYIFGGFMQDDELWGLQLVTSRDYYAGLRLEGPFNTDFTYQGTYLTTQQSFVDPNDPIPTLYLDKRQPGFSFYRSTFVVQQRLRSYDTFPGVPPSTLGFASDTVVLVFPFFWDKNLTGIKDYENVRGGAQIWTKLFGTGFGGTAFLLTVGYDAQYYYRINKMMHMGQLAIRMGWGDL